MSSAKRKSPLVITRAELAERLRERAPVIEESLVDSVRAMIDPRQYEATEYTSCQREAIEAVLAASLDEVERPGEMEAIPMAVAALARQDAQCGVGLETVIRRCMIIDRRMTEFIVGEAEGLSVGELRQVMQTWGGHVDRLVQFVSREYEQETERLQKSPEQRLAEWVQGLLDGEEPVESERDTYRFTAWHLAMIVGPGAPANELQGLAARLESQALILARADSTQWVWLGRQRPIPYAEFKRQLPADPELTVAVGESRWGIAGWRVSHREARAAQQVLKYQPRSVARCGEVALVAALTRDEILCRALVDAYLRPLDGPGSTGSTLRSTLRAYFAAGGNTKAAAAALDVDRHTIHRRLRKVEERLGVYIDACHAELEIALRVESLLPPQGVTEAHVVCR